MPLHVFVMDLLCIQPFYDRYLCEALIRAGVSVELGCVDPVSEPGYFERHGVPVNRQVRRLLPGLTSRNERLRRTLDAIGCSRNLARLNKALKANPPSIIHAQFLPLIDVIGQELRFLEACKKRGAKLVYTVHNIRPLHEVHGDWRSRYGKLYHAMDALICHAGQAMKTLMEEHAIPASRLYRIPHGPLFHDTPRIGRAAARRRLGLDPAASLVLILGRIRPYKGLDFLLDAMALVRDRARSARLIIAGNGEQKDLDALRSRIDALGLKDAVRTVFEYVGVEDLAAYHEASDMVVFPYREITQSGALFTAMAFARPIIATRLAEFEDVITDGTNGLLTDYGDAEGLAQKIVLLSRDEDLRTAMGERAAKTLDEAYSWDAIAAATLRCYRQIAKAS